MRFLVVVGAALSTVACSLAGPMQTQSVWVINSSSNHYVVRVGGAAAWDLPPHARGSIVSGRDKLEILDADNCVVVATENPTGDVLLNVDAQGRVDFVPQYEQPTLGDLLPTTACGAMDAS